MRALVSVVAVTWLGSNAEAQPELSLSGNLGFGGPGGIFSVMVRLGVQPWLFIEGDAGFSTAGTELGGGLGVALYEERGRTSSLGNYRARLTASALVTRSTTNDRDAGLKGAPWPELVDGAGTYTWGYAMAGIDLKVEKHLFLFTELGFAVGLGLERNATMLFDPKPDHSIGPAIRSGVGVTF